MDEFLACSDLCEENGLHEAAELLRSVSRARGRAFVVVERGWEYDDCIFEPDDHGQPRSIHFDREAAEWVAAAKNVAFLREHNITSFTYFLANVTDHSAEELSARIGAILGREYEFPEDRRSGGPTIPRDANEEQALAIAGLFTLKFAYLVETEFAG